jgi:hypothetical protein
MKTLKWRHSFGKWYLCKDLRVVLIEPVGLPGVYYPRPRVICENETINPRIWRIWPDKKK